MSAQLLDSLFVASYTRKIEYCKNNDSLNTNLSVYLVKYINAEQKHSKNALFEEKN